jgi:endoglucanase
MAEEAGSGAGGSGGAAAEPPPPAGDFEVATHTDSKWNAGQCDRVTVKNLTDHALIWSVKLTVMGTITDKWNTTTSGTTGEVTFSGADWNKSVAANATVEFGYCVAFGS